MAVSNTERQIRKLSRDIRKWCGHPGRMDLFSKYEDDVRKALSKDAPVLRTVGLNLGWLSGGLRFAGGTLVLDGNPDGWRQLALAAHYRLFEYRLRIPGKPLPSFSGLPLDLRNASLLLMSLLAFGAQKHSDRLGGRLLQSITDGGFSDDWKRTALPGFALVLWSRASNQGAVPEGAVAPPDVYAPLLDFDADATVHAAALVDACDYHLAETKPREHKLFPGSFDSGPFALWPVELQAWAAVMRRLGREVPRVSHPLLETPLGTLEPPTFEALPSDDLLGEVVEVAWSYFTW